MTDKPDEPTGADLPEEPEEPEEQVEQALVEESDELDLDPEPEAGPLVDDGDDDVEGDDVEGDGDVDLDDDDDGDYEDDDPIDDDVDSELEPEPEAAGAVEDIVVPLGAFAADEPLEERPEEHPEEPRYPSDEEPAEVAKKPKRRRGRRLLLGAVVLVGAVYVAGYFLTGARLPAHATIGGVDVGGKSPAAARDALEKALEPQAGHAIDLTYGKKTFQIKPQDVGLALDAQTSVERAGGKRSWDPRDMIKLFSGEQQNNLAFDYDAEKLQSAIATISDTVDKDVVEAQITFAQGKPVAREPKAGRVVSQSDAQTAILTTYLVSKKPIKVPTVRVEPTVDSAGLADAMKKLAEPAISGPVDLIVGDKEVSLPVSAYAPALTVQVEGGLMKLKLDPKKLAKPLTDSTTGIGKKAVDATVRIENNKPVVVPGKEGVGLQPEEMATRLIPVLTKTGNARSLEVEAKVVEPVFTTADAKALKITEKISEFTTEFPYAEYRNINQSRGAALINGTIIKPGETFSFNDTVGERTVANGFTTGTVINGGVFREELGGGVSQVVTTTYNAAFFGGMDDVEHHPHAFYIDRYPVGREATVYYGSLDLRFKNPTKYGVLIRAYVTKSTPSSPGKTHVELWSTKVWDKIEAGKSERRNFRTPGKQYDDTPQCVPQGPITGFDIDIYRKFVKDGKVVKTETDTANYQAADHVICGKKPKPKSDPTH